MHGSDADLSATTSRRLARLRAGLDTSPMPAGADGRCRGHDLISRCLRSSGVDHVYGVSGTPVYETHASCVEAGIRVVGMHHQQAAAWASAAHNYLAGRTASAVVASAGPALTNLATGLLLARDNGWPLLVLGGRPALDPHAFQGVSALPVLGPLSRHAASIDSPTELQSALREALHRSQTPPRGPVYLEIPAHVLQSRGLPPEPGGSSPSTAPATPEPGAAHAEAGAAERLRDWAATLHQARRPLVILGPELCWLEDPAPLEALVGRLRLPFVCMDAARGLLPDDHELCCNAIRAPALAAADQVLLLGGRLDWTLRFGAEIAPSAELMICQVDVRETLPPRATGADACTLPGPDAVAALLDTARSRAPAPDRLRAAWLGELDRWRQAARRRLEVRAEPRRSLGRLLATVASRLPPDAICVADGNNTLLAARAALCLRQPRSWLTPGFHGCIGIGLPFGVAAALQQPHRPTVVITGDMSLGFSIMELETAVRHRLPLIIIVANNDGNGGRALQERFFPPEMPVPVTMFQPGIGYHEIMRAVGGAGEHLEAPDGIDRALQRALERALTRAGPTCINVRIDE